MLDSAWDNAGYMTYKSLGQKRLAHSFIRLLPKAALAATLEGGVLFAKDAFAMFHESVVWYEHSLAAPPPPVHLHLSVF